MGFFSKFGAWIIGILAAVTAGIAAIFVAYEKGQSAEAGKVNTDTLKKTQADQKTANSIESGIAQLPPAAKPAVTVPGPATATQFSAAPVVPIIVAPLPVTPPALSEADSNSAAGRLNALTGGSA